MEIRTKFVVNCLRDKDWRLRMEVYNTLKQTWVLAQGKKLSSTDNLKLNFCKLLTHQTSKRTTLALKRLLQWSSHTKFLTSKRHTLAKKFCSQNLSLIHQGFLTLKDFSHKTSTRKLQTLSKRQAIAQKFIYRNSKLILYSLNHLKSYKRHTDTQLAKQKSTKEKICKRFSDKTIRDQCIGLTRLAAHSR
jgi:hypothetical protein